MDYSFYAHLFCKKILLPNDVPGSKWRVVNVYELGFYKSEPLVKPSLELIFEYPSGNKTLIISERPSCCIRGVIINQQTEHTVTLIAEPLISCSAYIFSFTNYDGVEKAIIYHATSCGPRFAQWIASQIASETDLSTVSIIIATPGDGVINLASNPDYIDIKETYLEYLSSIGFTSAPQILFGCTNYKINSKGKHGDEKCIHDLVFNSPKRLEVYSIFEKEEQSQDEKECTCFLL